jgi:glycine cleavage system aminomethyltransferase T
VVLETGLDDAVSYTKGCYVGQEIIARIHWRGHVAKKLAGITLDDDEDVVGGAKVRTSDDKEIGRLTSVEVSPRLGKTIALAYVKYDFLAPGIRVRVVTEDGQEREGVVAALPFVRGSWYGVSAQAGDA